MTSNRAVGRWIGVLLLTQMVLVPIVYFIALDEALAASKFLTEAAGHGVLIGVGVSVLIFVGVLGVVIASLSWRFFRADGAVLARVYFALAVVSCAVQFIEPMAMLSMRSLSEAYVAASAVDRPLLELIAKAVAADRFWAHHLSLAFGGVEVLFFYACLARGAWLPRWLAGLAMIGALLQIFTVTRPVFGGTVIFPLLGVLAIAHFASIVTLLVRGFPDRATGAA